MHRTERVKLTILRFSTKFAQKVISCLKQTRIPPSNTQKGYLKSKKEKVSITFEFWIFDLVQLPKISLLLASMVVTYYVKLFSTEANRHNGILMSVLFLFAEAKSTVTETQQYRLHTLCPKVFRSSYSQSFNTVAALKISEHSQKNVCGGIFYQ